MIRIAENRWFPRPNFARPWSHADCVYNVDIQHGSSSDVLGKSQQNRISISVLKQIFKKNFKIFVFQIFLEVFLRILDDYRFFFKNEENKKKIAKNGLRKRPLESVLRDIIAWICFCWLSPSFGVSKQFVFSFNACI